MSQRKFPDFLIPWQEANGENFTPTDFLGQGPGIEFAIAAQWLFNPNFFEYRGGVFYSDFPEDLKDQKKKSLDEWIEHFDGQVPHAEYKGNLTILQDLFSGCDLTPYEADLPQLAESVAQCWRGLLTIHFPEREFVVEVHDDENNPYDPQITFFSKPLEQPPAPTPTAVTVYDLPAGQFAPTEDVVAALHVDLPPSLRDEFAQISSTPSLEVDVRAIGDLPSFLNAIAPGTSTIHDAVNQARSETIVLAKFEQLWVKNRPLAEKVLAELPAALATAGTGGHPKHVALADLASSTVEDALELLRRAKAETTGPVAVFAYPAST